MTFDLLAEARNDGFRPVRKSASRSGQYNGACILPSCGGAGTDRLRIQANHGDYGWFACSVCGQKGSGVDWLMLLRGMSKNDALKTVGWKPKDGSEPHFTIPAHVLRGDCPSTREAPCEAWQTAGRAFVEYCEKILWSDAGREALEYLRGRGLKDESIKLARIGYNPSELKRPGPKWGIDKTVRLANGIVIPWFIDKGLWRITIRDESVVSGDGRYKQVAGGSNGLYLADFLGYRDRPVIVCEGEFDALSVAQECGKDVVSVATGTTTGSHTTKWIAELARCERVFIAFDAEKDKGDKAANWWIERLENAQRLRPLWADANQMLQDGIDLWADWVAMAVQCAETIVVTPNEQGPYIDPLNFCSVCREFSEQFTVDGVPYCKQHLPVSKQITTIDGVRVFTGYSDDEIRQIQLNEIREQARRPVWGKR